MSYKYVIRILDETMTIDESNTISIPKLFHFHLSAVVKYIKHCTGRCVIWQITDLHTQIRTEHLI